MKIAAGRVDGFLKSPDPAVSAVLLYGADKGQALERARTLTKLLVDDPADPFRVAELSAQTLKDEPSRLADEAQALSLTGGKRVVLALEAADGLAKRIEEVLDGPMSDVMLIFVAGELTARSKLRTLFEKADNAAALPCYVDEGRALDGVIRDTLSARGLSVDRDAMGYLLENLGADRMLTRRELEKLADYMGEMSSTVTLEDAQACIGDAAGLAMDDLCYAVADGDQIRAQHWLDRLFDEGVAAVAILRSVMRHFQKLHLGASKMSQGQRPDQVAKSMRIFFKREQQFIRQLTHWSPERSASALQELTQAEIMAKSTGMPDRAATSRALLRIGRAGQSRR